MLVCSSEKRKVFIFRETSIDGELQVRDRIRSLLTGRGRREKNLYFTKGGETLIRAGEVRGRVVLMSFWMR